MSNLNDFVQLPVRSAASGVANAYQQASNMKMSSTALMPKDYDRQPLDNLGPGEKTFRFSKGSLFGDVIVKITVSGWDPSSTQEMSGERGWGYRYISSLSYVYGNTNEYRVDGVANLLHVMDSTPNHQEKLRILELGGSAFNVPNVALRADDEVVYCVLSLPHSGGSGHCCADKTPYDSKMLEDDLEIKITFADGRQIYGDYGAFVGAGQNFPKFRAEVIMEKFAFVRSDASLAPSVKAGGVNEYAFMYPNYLAQSRIAPQGPVVNGKYNLTANISGWRQGSTTSMLLALLPDRDYSQTVTTIPTEYGLPQHNLFLQMTDIEVILDGQSIVNMKGDESQIRSLMRGPEDVFPMTTLDNGIDSSYTTIRLGQCAKKSILGENRLEAGVELVSKTLQFRFTVEASNVPVGGFTLVCIQNLNASLETAGSQNRIRFV